MIVLLDTSTPVCRLTLIDGARRHELEWEAHRELARGLLGFIESGLKQQAATFSVIHAIGVFEGPGSFTGLRIGLTVMNTLADALGMPIVDRTGDDWQEQAVLKLNRGENEQIVLPHYGSDAHITAPRK